MRILILNIYHPPDTGATAKILKDVAEALGEEHEVSILCGRPSYDPDERHPYYLFRREQWKNYTVERVGSTSFHRKHMLGRVSNFLSFMGLALLRTIVMRQRPDVIIAMTDPPIISVLGAMASIVRRCPLVYNIRDLHPDMAVAAGLIKPGPVVALWEKLHRWSMRRSDLVIVLGEDMRERILEKGIAPEKVVIVRDGALPLPERPKPNRKVIDEIRGDFPFVVVHGGNLGFAGAWDTLFQAAKRVEGSGAGLVMIGDGAARQMLEQKVGQLSNVRFLPYYPMEDVPDVLGAADLHVVTVKRGIEGLVVPSKLYPILMAGRPVLAVTTLDSDVAHIINEYQCGLVADPDDPEAVANAILEAKASPEMVKRMGENAKQAAKDFERGTELKRFVQIIGQHSGA